MMIKRTVVILVDNNKRDLPGCALIGHHLEEKFNIRCELQPLESWRSCLVAFKPDYILFNHVTASHLAYFSNRLAEMGVLVGVLPNEGINYNQEALEFNAGRYHSYAKINQFFCWNETHHNALTRNMNIDNIHVVGIPRFDYYFEPWKRLFINSDNQSVGKDKPRILLCTNFAMANFKDLPKSDTEKHFSPYKDKISLYERRWELIDVSARSRARVFAFLDSILDGTDYYLDLKPHPAEDHGPYKLWFERLSSEAQKRVCLRLTEMIFEVLPLCDLQISCERCTTALEAWILGKPTIELVFERYPVFFSEETAKCNQNCDSPGELIGLIEHTLKNPGQEDFKELRHQHLAKWCASPSGDSALKVAQAIANALERQGKPDWHFTMEDRRRALKLKMKNFMGLSYGSNLWKVLWGSIPGTKKDYLESKFIKPGDAKIWKEKLVRVDPGNKGGLNSTNN